LTTPQPAPWATLVTALATACVLLPALLLGDIPGLEIVRPAVVVILGGLLTSTVVSLFILPALFLALRVSAVQELELVPPTDMLHAGMPAGMTEAPGMGGGGK